MNLLESSGHQQRQQQHVMRNMLGLTNWLSCDAERAANTLMRRCAVAETLRAIIAALKEELPKLSEAGCFRDYGRLVLTLDEMIYEVRGLSSGIRSTVQRPAS